LTISREGIQPTMMSTMLSVGSLHPKTPGLGTGKEEP